MRWAKKHLFTNWGWFQDSVIKAQGTKKILEEYNKLGGSITQQKGTSDTVQLDDKDILALLIGGTHPNISNSFELERRRLGCHTNVGNHLWMWNKDVLNGMVPYDNPIKGNKTIQEELIDIYNELSGSNLRLV